MDNCTTTMALRNNQIVNNVNEKDSSEVYDVGKLVDQSLTFESPLF